MSGPAQQPGPWNQTMICVRDVPASSAWYPTVLAVDSGHGGDLYDQLVAGGELVLQLHAFEEDDHHEPLGDPSQPLGNGVVLWFEVADFDAAVTRIRAAGATIERGPVDNPAALQPEIWLRDPDGYRVVIAGTSQYRPR